MSDGAVILLILCGAVFYGKLCGIHNALGRIADVCEAADKRTKERVRS